MMSLSIQHDRYVSPGDIAHQPQAIEFTCLTCRLPSRNRAGQARPVWGLDYHIADAGEYSLDGRTWEPRRRHTAHLYAPGRVYWERRSARDLPFVETFFVFDGSGLPELDTLTAPGNGFAHFSDESCVLLGPVKTLVQSPADANLQWRVQGTLLLVLERLVAAQPIGLSCYGILPGSSGGNVSLSDRVDAYLQSHYEQRVVIDDIAMHVGVSRSTLTHRYHAETGTTPIARLTQYRLDVARAMVLKGERLKLVASQTGFCDEYHLSKAFKRQFGESPRAYLTTCQIR